MTIAVSQLFSERTDFLKKKLLTVVSAYILFFELLNTLTLNTM